VLVILILVLLLKDKMVGQVEVQHEEIIQKVVQAQQIREMMVVIIVLPLTPVTILEVVVVAQEVLVVTHHLLVGVMVVQGIQRVRQLFMIGL
jgi:hypothetical protein